MKNGWRRRDALLAFLCLDFLISADNAADTVATQQSSYERKRKPENVSGLPLTGG